jgi:hypothetical protein
MGRVLGLMEGSQAETNLVFLDACRNNPFKKVGEVKERYSKVLLYLVTHQAPVLYTLPALVLQPTTTQPQGMACLQKTYYNISADPI